MNQTNGQGSMDTITIVGGGLAGLTAAIACAEGGGEVRLLEAHEELGGRARSNERPVQGQPRPPRHLQGRPVLGLAGRARPAAARTPAHRCRAIRFRWQGKVRRTPPLGTVPSVLRLRGREAPVDVDFRSWVAGHSDERTAEMLSAAAGVYTFHHDPGELSAAFVWKHSVRVLLSPPPTARYLIGGWSALVASLEGRVRRSSGSRSRPATRVEALPDGPTIVATELEQARELLGDDSLEWPSGNTVCLDLGLSRRRGDPFVVSDLDEAGWIERFSAPDPSLAPDGEELVQAQMPVRPGESAEPGGAAPRAAARRLAARLARARDLAPTTGDGAHAPARSTTRARAGATGRRSTAATASSSPATWSPRPDCSPRFPGPSAVEASRLALEAAARPQLRRVA